MRYENFYHVTSLRSMMDGPLRRSVQGSVMLFIFFLQCFLMYVRIHGYPPFTIDYSHL